MCGRYYIEESMASELEKIVCNLDEKIKNGKFTGEIKPSMAAPVICSQSRHKSLEVFRWGFQKYQGGGLVINARAESAADKKMFADAVADKRCIIPASGFYEWDASKNKFRFTDGQSKILYLAGIFRQEQEEAHFVILTTAANASMQPVHERMPVVLRADMLEPWLSDDRAAKEILRAEPPLLTKHTEMEQMRLEF